VSIDFFLIEEIVVFTLALTVELSRISDSRIIMTQTTNKWSELKPRGQYKSASLVNGTWNSFVWLFTVTEKYYQM